MADEFFEMVGTEAEPSGRSSNVKPVLETAALRGTVAIRRWSKSDDIFWPASDTVEKLDSGFYRFYNLNNIGACLRRATTATDGLIHMPDTVGERVLGEFATFWRLRDRFSARGFLHKRGILLWGPPGSGKTCSLMLMADEIIRQREGIVCMIEEPGLAAICLQFIRRIEPERPIVALMEDLDALVHAYGETSYLALLDGETQVDRICYIATTNYPERLDRRFVDRPSRFDTVEFIGMPGPEARSVYLRAKEPSLTDTELANWVARTEGFSVAHLRELIILERCFEWPLDKAIARLDAMRVRRPDSERSPDHIQPGIVGP
jgi:hypothetical protein